MTTLLQNRSWIWALGLGALLMAAGSWVVFYALQVHATSPLRFGTLNLLVALVHVVLGVLLRRYYALGRHLLLAALYACIGAAFLAFPNTLPVAFVILIGYAFVALGLLRIGSALIRRGLPGRTWLFPAGLLSIAIGVIVLLAWPTPALWLVRMLIGVELFVGGAVTFAFAFVLRRQSPAEAAARYEGYQPRALVRAVGLLTVTVLFLAGIWLSLLPLTQRYVNRMFAELPSVHAKLGTIELDVRKRIVILQGFRMRMTGPGQTNTFKAEQMIMRPDLRAILGGKLMGSVAVINPTIQFTRPAPDERAKPGEMAGILGRVRRLAPFRIDRLDVRGARVDLKNVMPELDVSVRRFHLTGRNLANSAAMRRAPHSTFQFEGRAMGARLAGELRSNLTAKTPTLRIKARLRGLRVVKVNDYLKSEYKIAAERGTLTAYTEVSVKGRQIDGYARTYIKDLKVSTWPPPAKAKGPLRKLGRMLKEAIQDLGVKALSRRGGVIATETPLRGELGSAELDLLSAAGSTLRNAFGKSLESGFKRVSKDVGFNSELETTRMLARKP